MSERSELDDQQLGERLRDLPIPADLAEQLRAIAQTESSTDGYAELSSRGRTPRSDSEKRLVVKWQVTVFLTAAAAVVLGVFAWQFLLNVPKQPLAHTPAQKPRDSASAEGPLQPNAPLTNESADTEAAEVEQLLAAHRQRHQDIQALINEMEFDQLVNRREALLHRNSQPDLSFRETFALTLAVSAETMQMWDGDTSVVTQRLTQVVQNFPETRGAERAKRNLATN